ncbi:serine/threonine-protein kinase [Mycobacterium sp.]|uniref:serine/threonine-protein kinase n=1 Tax=Mycobacterium sp. TaxID=1785 RepID=UPI0025F5A8C7|nr:serine/threonine-protein kinase [Mycobacterium sp.]
MLVGVEPGSELAGYRIERVLAAGGMGTVYLAHDPVLPRLDALKVLGVQASKDAGLRQRFTRESDTGAMLHHPNIVSIYSRGEAEDGQLWMAMQYVAGTDAEAALAAGTMNPARALRVVREVAKALDYAHRLNVVHNDVKPSNILLSSGVDGEDDEHILLSDFGISRTMGHTDTPGVAPLTLSLAYAAPEAIAGNAITGSADIYSLGCTLFRLLTNKHVFSQADGTSALVEAHLRQPPPRISDFLSGSSPQLDSVIAKVLAKDPDQRFHSAREFAAAAHQALQHTIPHRDQSERSQRDQLPPPPVRRPAADGPAPFTGPWQPANHLPPPHRPLSMPPTNWRTAGGAPPHRPGVHHPGIHRPPAARRIALAASISAALIGAVIYALSSHSSPPPPPPAASPQPSPVTTTTVSPDPSEQARLAGTLPKGYPPGECAPATLPTSQALAAIRCGPNIDPGGPTSATYTLTRDTTALRKALDDIVRSATPVICPPNILSPGPWHHTENPTAAIGVVFCGTRSGHTVVAWTNEPERLLSEAVADAAGPPLEQLFDWWASHS